MNPMRYLGIDYGEKRIGVALSDAEGKIAFPHMTISADGPAHTKTIATLCHIIQNEKAGEIVVGLPRTLDGRETRQTAITRGFMKKLQESLTLPIYTENEILTTRIAVKDGVAKKDRDAASAALILQSYLDKKK